MIEDITSNAQWQLLESERLRYIGLFSEIWAKYYKMIEEKADKMAQVSIYEKCNVLWDSIQETEQQKVNFLTDYLNRH